MNAELLLRHFNRISDAPDSVQRLRQLILDLAVRGRLVEANSSDECASVLLNRIQKQRARMVEKGEIKKQETLPVDAGDEPFPLPTHWVWTRLGTIADWGAGSTPARGNLDLFGGGITWLKSGELNDNRQLAGSEENISELALTKGSFRLNQPGDVLLAMYGATIGKVAILAEPAVTNQAVCGCTPLPGVSNLYLFNFLLSQRSQFQAASEGGAQPNISKIKILGFAFPLPPLAEQHRIVAKVDELMALCDRLEAAQRERENRRDQLAASTHHHLNNGADAEALRSHAQFFIGHLPRLTTRPNQVKQFRQTILNLAVRGKLVLQDQNDEPATALMQRISTEKLRLNRLGLIRAEKALREIDPALFFELPQGWKWANWDSVALKIGDIDHKMPETVTNGIPFISPRDFLPGNGIDFEGAKRVSREDFLRLSLKVKASPGDLIYPRYGTIGENRLVTEERDFLVSYSCAVVKVMWGFVDPKFQYIFSVSSLCKEQAKAAENKTTQANVGIKSIQEFAFPLPPLAEQHRIVAKVDELMALCDQLESRLTTAQTEAARLLESVLHHALQTPA